MNYLILLSLVAVAQSLSDTTDTASKYCEMQNLCSYDMHGIQKKHIACDFTGSTDAWCADANIITLNKFGILKIHNDLRQKVASGKLQKSIKHIRKLGDFPAASHMAELQWDDELEQLALYNAKRCQFKHDECRSTTNFKKAGQNIAYRTDESDRNSLTKTIIESQWFNEYEVADMNLIHKYQTPKNTVGHFLQIVKDSATHIGCAGIVYQGPKGYNIFQLICNYGRTNMKNEPTYEIGPPASKCQKRSLRYSALCSVY